MSMIEIPEIYASPHEKSVVNREVNVLRREFVRSFCKIKDGVDRYTFTKNLIEHIKREREYFIRHEQRYLRQHPELRYIAERRIKINTDENTENPHPLQNIPNDDDSDRWSTTATFDEIEFTPQNQQRTNYLDNFLDKLDEILGKIFEYINNLYNNLRR